MKREDLVNNSSMSAFTMYIDDQTKLNTLIRLKNMQLREPDGSPLKKGPLAPTIRVLLNMFANGEINISSEQIVNEYLLTTKKNKRSSL